MVVVAFVQGMTVSPFGDSLFRNRVDMLSEVRERDATHIEAGEVVLRKNGSSRSKQPKYKENNQDHSAWSNEVSTEKITD